MQIGELESLLDKSERSLLNFQAKIQEQTHEIDSLKKKYLSDATKYEEEIKVVKSERIQLETSNLAMQDQIQQFKLETEQSRKEAHEFRYKYESYKNICEK
jgi:hypothetical protein